MLSREGFGAPPIAVVVNPTAGRGAALRALPLIQSALKERGKSAEYFQTSERGHAEELAKLAIESGSRLIVAVGGDGTLHEVTNAILKSGRDDVTLGLIPFGTGNDFARGVGLGGDLTHVITALVDGVRHRIDIGEIVGVGLNGTRNFLVAAGVGFVADTAKTVNEGIRGLTGPAAYIYGAIRTLRHFTPIELSMSLDGAPAQQLAAMLLSISNVATTGGGIRIAPKALPDDGLLDLCLVAKISKFKLMQKLPGAFLGKHVGDPSVTMLRAKTIDIKTSVPVQLWIDGEVMGMTPARVQIREAALPMMLPDSYVRTRGN